MPQSISPMATRIAARVDVRLELGHEDEARHHSHGNSRVFSLIARQERGEQCLDRLRRGAHPQESRVLTSHNP